MAMEHPEMARKESSASALADGMERLARLRRLEGVTEQTKTDAVRLARRHLDFDLDEVYKILRDTPAILSAAFAGSVMGQREMTESGQIRILVDLDESQLPDDHNDLVFLGDLDEKLTPVFGGRQVDSETYNGVQYEITCAGGPASEVYSAHTFYVR